MLEQLLLPQCDFYLYSEEGVWFDNDAAALQAAKWCSCQVHAQGWHKYQGTLKDIEIPAAYCDGE